MGKLMYMDEEYASNGIDYIIDHGTYNDWTYRKWSSGISECWGVFYVASKTYPANGGVVMNPPNMPSGLFKDTSSMVITPMARINSVGNSSAGYTAANNTTQIQVWVLNHSAAAQTQTAYVHVHIYGKWK